MRDVGFRTVAASTLAELTTLFRTPDRRTHRSNAELARAARVLIRAAFLILAAALFAQGILLLAAGRGPGTINVFPHACGSATGGARSCLGDYRRRR